MTVTPSDLAATLRRRYRAELIREADRRAEVRGLLDRIVAELDLPAGCRLRLIGSLLEEHWGERSDIDLVVEGLDRESELGLWRRLSSALPVPVDLLRLEELSEGFRRRVLAEGVVLGEP